METVGSETEAYAIADMMSVSIIINSYVVLFASVLIMKQRIMELKKGPWK